MRTLVLGIPLPHPTFDNYSFLSAPSFSDYPRLVVDMASISRVVQEAAAAAGQHRTYDGQPVLPGPTSAQGFGLRELLEMRRREARLFLDGGGVIALLAHPDVPHPDLVAWPGWRRYGWLPAPEGLRYEEHLLPAFGNQGVILAEAAHPFAPWVEEFGPQLSYRVHVDESAPGFDSYGRVFARSPGGAAAGVALAVAAGAVVLLPLLVRFEQERQAMAETLFRCFQRWQELAAAPAPDWMRKEVT